MSNQNPLNLTDDQIDELKNQHGELHVLTTDEDDAVIVVRPSKPKFEKYKAFLLDEKKRLKASETLVRDCVVAPDKATLGALFEDKPFLIETFAQKLAELGGARENVEVKKL